MPLDLWLKLENQVSVSLWSIIHSYDSPFNFYMDISVNMFPSPYGVIFILTSLSCRCRQKINYVSVSLWSYIHSYENLQLLYSDKENDLFPSPYRVLFILMNSNFLFQDLRFGKGFPSPYGVIFILTCKKK